MARPARYDRDEVLERALELFWAKGYHATSLKDLEQALDMRPGSIYAAFGSKEALFGETLKLYATHSREEFRAVLEAGPTPIAALAAYVRRLGCAGAQGRPTRACMLVKTLLETPDDDPVLRQQAEALIQNTEGVFAGVFRQAQAAGEIDAGADPERLASRLQAAIFGMRAYAQRTNARDRVAALADDIASDIEALAAH
ncbi:TetR/AcrR family transcriptional regulator [Pseudooceanicola sp. LIPI14-2-Ac024]|uniref:TetR/AcrR family transcriptional regulator n=1 Tax=Pseudooceanicola sp. LIPI14-2-Ac024 TaxID=3344875 RepID=UPI0035CFCDFF